jgi:hypothetical protein
MLILLCVQIVQTNNNEFKMGFYFIFNAEEQKNVILPRKQKILIKKI